MRYLYTVQMKLMAKLPTGSAPPESVHPLSQRARTELRAKLRKLHGRPTTPNRAAQTPRAIPASTAVEEKVTKAKASAAIKTGMLMKIRTGEKNAATIKSGEQKSRTGTDAIATKKTVDAATHTAPRMDTIRTGDFVMVTKVL